MSACAMCGAELPPPLRVSGRPRKFCSERCRKRQYDLACVDCGGRVSGTDPGDLVGRDPRCRGCAARMRADRDRYWTRERIIARIQEWADLHGEPPAVPDWYPPIARRNNDEARARRFTDADGHWPWMTRVVGQFGTWNAAIKAAGFSPRPTGGVAVNIARQRRFRKQVAA